MKIYRMNTEKWFLERIIFLMAGIFVSVGVILGIMVSEWFLYFAALVGAMQIIFALTGYCPMAILLNKLNIKEK